MSNRGLLLVGLFLCALGPVVAEAQEGAKPRMKMGAYYFAGWSGKCPYDDGSASNAWAKGMPTHYTKKLATESPGAPTVWGWRDDTPALMERQIDLAADHGVAYFSFAGTGTKTRSRSM
jgi:hypothetical protein